MAIESNARLRHGTATGRAESTARVCVTLAVAGAMLVGVNAGAPTVARADGGLETQKGGLFHRKGWIAPAIYKKPERIKLASRSNLGGPVAPSTSAKPAETSAKRSGTSSSRRIPASVVKRRESKVAKTRSRRKKGTKVASLGKSAVSLPRSTKSAKSARSGKSSKSASRGRVQWSASSGCVPGRLKSAIYYVAAHYGRVRVNSTCRSKSRNRRVGGAGKSWHLKGMAADIRVFGNVGKAARYLRKVAGGYKHYGGGRFHIDTGPRRSW